MLLALDRHVELSYSRATSIPDICPSSPAFCGDGDLLGREKTGFVQLIIELAAARLCRLMPHMTARSI